MSSHQQTQLNLGNRIYLYQLLRSALGVGKQTFITQAEEALTADELSAESLGFETTRALMEALDEFVTLTVFKGGRVYVTVMAQPAWDDALNAAEATPTKTSGGKGGKPWKRKKGSKTLKAVRPRTVVAAVAEEPKAAAEATEAAPAAGDEVEAAAVADGEPEGAPVTDDALADTPAADDALETKSDADDGLKAESAAGTDVEGTSVTDDALADTPVAEAADGADDAPASEPAAGDNEAMPEAPAGEDAPSTPHVPEPAYSLTVTFDPDHADAGETTVVSTPVAANAAGTPASAAPSSNAADAPALTAPSGSAAVPHREAPAAAPARAAQGTAAAAQASALPSAEEPPDLDGYPRDFTTDVYCSGATLAALARLLPYGADVLGIAGEYFYIACLRGTVELRRGRASFPLYYLHDGVRHAATVTIKKRACADPAWVIDTVELPDEQG